MKRVVQVVVLSSLLAPALRAQDAVTTSFRFFGYHYGAWLVQAFEAIPASSYSYRPTPPQQTVGYIAQHLEGANYGLCSRLGYTAHPSTPKDALTDTVKAAWPKDTLVARLRASLAYCDAAIKALPDPKLADEVDFGPPGAGLTAKPARTLVAFVTDLAEHYSQIASYMRLLNLTPPSAPGFATHAVANVPANTLAQYVGRYALVASPWQDSPAVTLEVTMNGGALGIAVVGRPGRKLWPESSTDFFVKESDLVVKFQRDASGAVTGLLVRQNGEDRPATRIRP